MNKEAILAVADVIEYADRLDMTNYAGEAAWTAAHKAVEDEARRTNDWKPYWAFMEENDAPDQAEVVPTVWDNCGTTACIAGWTLAWADIKPSHDGNFDLLAGKELGLEDDQAYRLFVSSDWWSSQGFDFDTLTAKQAARTLRKIAAGKIAL